MGKIKKIAVCAAAVAGAAGIAGISDKAVEGVRKKWFLRGFETGKIVGNLTAAESFARDKVVIQQKLDKLSFKPITTSDAFLIVLVSTSLIDLIVLMF